MTEKMKVFIETAIADGELEAQEIAFLRRKAEELGDDPDEVEMTAKAELAYLKNSSKTNSNKLGDVKKCPSCGAVVPSMNLKCSDCGHEFSNVQANSSAQKLFDAINRIEESRDTSANKTNNSTMGAVFGSMMEMGADPVDIKLASTISNFPVPSTKADIIEFLILTAPKAKKLSPFSAGGKSNRQWSSEKVLNKAWHSKFMEVMTKAKLLLSDDKEAINTIEQIKKEYKL